jgi:hypothetical protein
MPAAADIDGLGTGDLLDDPDPPEIRPAEEVRDSNPRRKPRFLIGLIL